MKELEQIDILLTTFADHSPILLQLGSKPKEFNWKLNTSHQKNEGFIKQVKEDMNFFFKQIYEAGNTNENGLAGK